MWGTTSFRDELTDDFGGPFEGTSIDNCRLFGRLGGNSIARRFGTFATLSGAKLTLRSGALARFFSRRGRIHIEKINGPFLFREKGAPAEYKAGLDLAIDRGWLVLHQSGTYVKFTQAGADLFA